MLATRPHLQAVSSHNCHVAVWPGFYRLTSTQSGLQRWPRPRKGIKAFEHRKGVGTLVELVEELRPKIVHVLLGNASKLAAALARLLQNREQIRMMGEAASDQGKVRFTGSAIVRQTIQVRREIRPCGGRF